MAKKMQEIIDAMLQLEEKGIDTSQFTEIITDLREGDSETTAAVTQAQEALAAAQEEINRLKAQNHTLLSTGGALTKEDEVEDPTEATEESITEEEMLTSLFEPAKKED